MTTPDTQLNRQPSSSDRFDPHVGEDRAALPENSAEQRAADAARLAVHTRDNRNEENAFVYTGGNDMQQLDVWGSMNLSNGEAGYVDMQGGDDYVQMTIDESTHGEFVVQGGSGHDVVMIQSLDDNAQLVRLDDHTMQLVQQTAAGMLSIRLENVEEVRVQNTRGEVRGTSLEPGI